MFYEETISAIRIALRKRFLSATPFESLSPEYSASNILWMAERVEHMDRSSLSDAVRAARWIGWMLHVCETDLYLWDNALSRDLIRKDVSLKNDLPRKSRRKQSL